MLNVVQGEALCARQAVLIEIMRARGQNVCIAETLRVQFVNYCRCCASIRCDFGRSRRGVHEHLHEVGRERGACRSARLPRPSG